MDEVSQSRDRRPRLSEKTTRCGQADEDVCPCFYSLEALGFGVSKDGGGLFYHYNNV